MDVDNFVKPIIDALAAGLFCDPQIDPNNIPHWNYDDSNFNTLLIRACQTQPPEIKKE